MIGRAQSAMITGRFRLAPRDMPQEVPCIEAPREYPSATRRDAETGNWFASTLARGLAVMAAFGMHDGWLGNAELARRTQLPKSTVSRLSATLVALGYLQRSDSGKLRPGLRLLARVYPVLRGLPIRELARPRLQALATQIDGVVAIAAADGPSLVLVEVARGPQCRSMHPDEGHHLPLVQLAAGRAVLAACNEGRRTQLLAGIGQKWPELAALHREQTRAAISDCQRLGHCFSADDFESGSASLALPLLTLADGLHLAVVCTVYGQHAQPRDLLHGLAPLATTLCDTLRAQWAAARVNPRDQ